jgi:competence ComEA-like helix-hairpin-helix protein
MKFATLVVTFFLVFAGSLFAQKPLEKLENLSLLDDRALDADSFHVTYGTTQHHLRLYLVDAPETEAGDATMARRVREQTCYFGLPSAEETLALGKAAAERTRELLSRPFTAYTAGTSGLGRSTEPRVYAYVVTAEGRDLAEQLVAEGWARAQGMGRINYAGVTQAEQRARLADLELTAALGRLGVWAKSDPARLLAMRAEERRESGELAAISAVSSGAAPSSDGAPIDLNTATEAQLQSLSGIGPALAKRIVEARPYTTVDDLVRVRGIGPAVLERVRDSITVGEVEP